MSRSMARELPNKINVLLVGGGGREHALAWKMRQSKRLGKLWLSDTKNAALQSLGTAVDVPVSAAQPFRVQRFCEQNDIGLVVIGPEDPLAEGLADVVRSEKCAVFGPNKDGARLEADKAWAKQLMRAASIPTAESRTFTDATAAKRFLIERSRSSFTNALTPPFYLEEGRNASTMADERFWSDLQGRILREGGPSEAASSNRPEFEIAFEHALSKLRPNHVVKAAGLAKGKGVYVPSTLGEALQAIDEIMVQRVHGDAGSTVLIEEQLSGPEVSVLALVDGRTIYVLEPCQDHKRLLDGGRGPNTGGMGAYCPTDIVDDAMMTRIQREVLVPTVDALRREGIDYRGVLYAGLMLTHGGPKVLEFNVRFGDPECQPLMARLKGDLVEILWRTATGTLSEASIDWDSRTACTVVLASRGYPEKPETGFAITGLDNAAAVGDVQVFHAGTTKDKTGKVVTSGGRVLGVTALGSDLATARDLANQACEAIHFDGMQYRRDIGSEALETAKSGSARR